jgi:hypothetical protein
VAIGAEMGEVHGIAGAVGFAIPHQPAKAFGAAVQLQLAAGHVGRQFVGHAIEGEARILDAIGHAPGERAEMGVVLDVARQMVEAEDDRTLALGRRDAPIANDHAEADDIDLDAAFGRQVKLVDALARVFSEIRCRDGHGPSSPEWRSEWPIAGHGRKAKPEIKPMCRAGLDFIARWRRFSEWRTCDGRYSAPPRDST